MNVTGPGIFNGRFLNRSLQGGVSLPFVGPFPNSTVPTDEPYSSKLPPINLIYPGKPPKVLDINGAKVVLEHDPNALRTEINIFVKCGLMTDPLVSIGDRKVSSGLSHVVEHSMFLEAGGKSHIDIKNEARSLGAELNAATTHTFTAYQADSFNEKATETLKLLLGILFSHKFTPRFQTALAEEINQIMTNELDIFHLQGSGPFEQFKSANSTSIWNNHPFYTNGIGTRETISKIGVEDIAEYLFQNYALNNMVFSIRGDFNEGELTRTIEEGTKHAAKTCSPKVRPPYVFGGKGIMGEADFEDNNSSLVIFTAEGPKANSGRRVYAAALLDYLLEDSLQSKLRDQERLGYGFRVHYSSNHMELGGNGFLVTLMADRSRMGKAIELAIKEIKKMEKGDFDTNHLEAAKRLHSYKLFEAMNNPGLRAAYNAASLMSSANGNLTTIPELLAPYATITADEVREAASILSTGKIQAAFLGTDPGSINFDGLN